MKKCPRCKYKNTDTTTHCEQCGFSLPKSAPFPPDLVEYIAPPLIGFTTSTQPDQKRIRPALQHRTLVDS